MRQELRVLYCECAHAGVLSPQAKQEVRRALNESGLPFDIVPDLCELAARKSSRLAELAGAASLALAACHPRAVKWLFAAGGAPLPETTVTYVDMREAPGDDLLRLVHNLAAGTVGGPAAGADPSAVVGADGAPQWQPWFPVIDYERCENCQQCLSFCLFGVYAVDADGRVQVSHPANCKNGCPACARVCPSASIIFPKYPNAPINGGELKDGEVAEPLKIDKAVLLNGDTLKILQDRGKHALQFARGADEFRALQERWKHVAGSGRPLTLVQPGAPPAPPAEEPS
jgi:NAD-dependent dihydropyrimidine dehydrogenase PreA subunit